MTMLKDNWSYYPLMGRFAGDPRMIQTDRGLARDKSGRYPRRVAERMRGVIFTQQERLQWAPEPDCDSIILAGRWLGGNDCMGGFKGKYITTRAYGGFAVYFWFEQDAECYLTQCLENPGTFRPGDFLTTYHDGLGQKSTQKIPGPESRALSAAFPWDVVKRLYYYRPARQGKGPSTKEMLTSIDGIGRY